LVPVGRRAFAGKSLEALIEMGKIIETAGVADIGDTKMLLT
jgi:hypothetical protein